MKTSKKGDRVDVPIRKDLHRKAAHLAVDRNTTIQIIVDELIEIGLSHRKIMNQEKHES